MEHILWKNNELILLDQRRLPEKKEFISCRTPEETASAIRDMVVRGAPAIGITAAYGLALSAMLNREFDRDCRLLLDSRPTAVNLRWAVERMRKCHGKTGGNAAALAAEALKIHMEDIEMNRQMGDLGAALFQKPVTILTHCNAGALATGGYGTALGVIRSLYRQRKLKEVFADETRPYLQGARLTAFELAEAGIPHRVITDNSAGYFMAKGEIDAVITGADRIAANGDTANKIGTMVVAVLARYFKIPFYIAAPMSSFDLSLKSGAGIPIEERSRDEVAFINGKPIVPAASPVSHIGFDVTPGHLVTGFITNRGILHPPFHPDFG
ncbi:MAG: S-methyl-5-thioribose-1-phosphate isomerase [Acidobacteria bacterium]|nr:S-methyl-5-thioribose-1-phosphate isomerase [Acidobacteriota bacterium]